jgi:hypothetical protein
MDLTSDKEYETLNGLRCSKKLCMVVIPTLRENHANEQRNSNCVMNALK